MFALFIHCLKNQENFMGIKSALKSLFSSKEDKKETISISPKSFSELKVGNTFQIDICDVMEMCNSTFQVMEEFKYAVDAFGLSSKVLTIKNIDTNAIFRATESTIDGEKYIRIDKLLSDDEVLALFRNEDEEDFTHIFSDDLTVMFKMKRFCLGDESLVQPLLDWSDEEYKFKDDIGIQGYIERNGSAYENIQYYSLYSPKRDYGVIIENYEDGIAKIYLSHYLAPTNISSFI